MCRHSPVLTWFFNLLPPRHVLLQPSHYKQWSYFDLYLLFVFLPLITEITRWSHTRKRQEHAHSFLIFLILRVLPPRDQFREPSRSLKQYQIREGANNGPVEPALGDEGGPEVEQDPDGLLGGEVGVPAVGPHADCVEATIEVFAVEAGGDFGGCLVGLFGFLVFY